MTERQKPRFNEGSGNVFGRDIRGEIIKSALDAHDDYCQHNDLKSDFESPVIGFADPKNPLFTAFYNRGWMDHPKDVYRPGNTIIVHRIPFSPLLEEYNRRAKGGPAEEWVTAFNESIMLSSHINGAIMDKLDELGRLRSLTTVPTDWNQEECKPSWSHKLCAFVAGMGDFTVSRGFKYNYYDREENSRIGARFNTLMTDFTTEPTKDWSDLIVKGDTDASVDNADKVCDELITACGYEKFTGKNKIKNFCPAGAIGDKVDAIKCQEYCKTIDPLIPTPDVCGKCQVMDNTDDITIYI